MNKPKIVVILGPTASGKSNLAVLLAQKYNGEVVSADSRQIYKGLDLGTGKITQKEMKGVRHHLLDVVSPQRRYTVVDFQTKAHNVISDILHRGKLPIICGGTGFYIQSIIDNTHFPDVTPNKQLRAKLSKYTCEVLIKKLEGFDPARAASIDQHNKVKIIRAIEIATALGYVPPATTEKKYNALMIGIRTDDAVLKAKIHARLLARLKKGMVKEVGKLHENGLSWKRMHELGLEYRFVSLFLQKKMTKQEMIDKLSSEIWHYARRQKTWFRRDARIQWFSQNELKKINKTIKAFMQ